MTLNHLYNWYDYRNQNATGALLRLLLQHTKKLFSLKHINDSSWETASETWLALDEEAESEAQPAA